MFNQYIRLLLNGTYLAENKQVLIVLSLVEHPIYRTRFGHANNYTSNAVKFVLCRQLLWKKYKYNLQTV